MEWTMPVNDIFDEEVTKISATMLPKNFSGDVRTTRSVQEQIAKLIDTLGEESASSQGLNKVITSAEKLRSNPTHSIYLLKDYRACDGKGEIIGLLKVGRKHLFLFDDKQAVHEVEPLCVLDFYIVRDRQRMGFGRMLFDFVLHELEVTADQLAIDGPSDKMEQFLARNFGINNLMRQNNNFAVARSFFDRSDDEISSNCAGDATVAPAAAVGRFAAPRPTSAIANVIHGAHDEATRRSPSPAAGQQGAAATEPVAAAAPAREDFHGWENEYSSEPELDDDPFERYAFESMQPAAERHGPVRYRVSPALERPASLPVQRSARPTPSAPPAEPAAVPAAGMPSGGASAASTPAGSVGRRDSQLTDKGYFDVKYYHNRLCSPPAAATEPRAAAAAALVAIEAAAAAAEADVAAAEVAVAEAEAAVAEAEVAAAEAEAAAAKAEVAAAEAEAAVKASAAAARPVDPYAGEYGFEDYEYPSSPELDDDEYERYSFDPDQPAFERRDEQRARGNRYN